MNEEHSMQFFLSNLIPEDKIINEINSVLNFLVETIDISVKNSVGFLQVMEYSEGFKLGCLISWPENVQPNLDVKELGELLTEKFRCEILCEANDNEWYLVKPSGETTKVTVKNLDDGIAVIT